MPAAVDELHVGDVGLAAEAAATRGSRPTDSPHHSGGIEVHMDSSPTRFTTPMRITLSLASPVVGLVLLVAMG